MVDLKDRVEQLLDQHGFQPASESAGHFDGYLVEPSVADSLIVRCGFGTQTAPPWQLQNLELEACERILSDAGLRVKRVIASRGGYLVVMEN